MNNQSREKIGSRLRAAREYLGLSQEHSSDVTGISRSAISLIESGQRRLEAMELMALAKLYQRPMAYFTDDDFSADLNPDAAVFARQYSELSESDQKELRQFAEFLAMKAHT